MLIITKRILGPGFSFASTRARGKKDRASMQEETPEEQDAFRSYRKQV